MVKAMAMQGREGKQEDSVVSLLMLTPRPRVCISNVFTKTHHLHSNTDHWQLGVNPPLARDRAQSGVSTPQAEVPARRPLCTGDHKSAAPPRLSMTQRSSWRAGRSMGRSRWERAGALGVCGWACQAGRTERPKSVRLKIRRASWNLIRLLEDLEGSMEF